MLPGVEPDHCAIMHHRVIDERHRFCLVGRQALSFQIAQQSSWSRRGINAQATDCNNTDAAFLASDSDRVIGPRGSISQAESHHSLEPRHRPSIGLGFRTGPRDVSPAHRVPTDTAQATPAGHWILRNRHQLPGNASRGPDGDVRLIVQVRDGQLVTPCPISVFPLSTDMWRYPACRP